LGIVPIPQNDAASDAKQPNGGRQRGYAIRHPIVQGVDATQSADQAEHGKGASDAAEHGRCEVMPLKAAECEGAARKRKR
jgi:hypothetical protein